MANEGRTRIPKNMTNEKTKFATEGESRLEHSEGILANVVSDIVDEDCRKVWNWSSKLEDCPLSRSST